MCKKWHLVKIFAATAHMEQKHAVLPIDCWWANFSNWRTCWRLPIPGPSSPEPSKIYTAPLQFESGCRVRVLSVLDFLCWHCKYYNTIFQLNYFFGWSVCELGFIIIGPRATGKMCIGRGESCLPHLVCVAHSSSQCSRSSRVASKAMKPTPISIIASMNSSIITPLLCALLHTVIICMADAGWCRLIYIWTMCRLQSP